jgi:immunity protein Imm1 of predicted polymorphic toxin system
VTWNLLCEGADSPRVVGSFVEIEEAIQQAVRHARQRHGRPTLIELSLVGQSTMAIVAGGKRSYAAFTYGSPGPGFYARRRDTLQQGDDDPFIYMQFGSRSEADLDTTILPEDAWEALRLYFATGKRPETLDWGP